MSTTTNVAVSEIRSGDVFGTPTNGWTAREDAERRGSVVEVNVEYIDGGIGRRVWDDPERRIDVVRP